MSLHFTCGGHPFFLKPAIAACLAVSPGDCRGTLGRWNDPDLPKAVRSGARRPDKLDPAARAP
jgi:hypothetical protein